MSGQGGRAEHSWTQTAHIAASLGRGGAPRGLELFGVRGAGSPGRAGPQEQSAPGCAQPPPTRLRPRCRVCQGHPCATFWGLGNPSLLVPCHAGRRAPSAGLAEPPACRGRLALPLSSKAVMMLGPLKYQPQDLGMVPEPPFHPRLNRASSAPPGSPLQKRQERAPPPNLPVCTPSLRQVYF